MTLGAGLEFVDTGAAWAEDVYRNIAVEVNPGADSIQYFYNNSLIYTSVAGVFGGTTIEQVVIATDNTQLPGEFANVDNIVVVPESGTAGLLGAGIIALGGAGVVVRRRKSTGA